MVQDSEGGRPGTLRASTGRRRGRGGGRTIALTGVNSSLGSHLVALAERSRRWRRVVTIDLAPSPASGPKTAHYHVDLTQPAIDGPLADIFRAEQVDVVVHGAFLDKPTTATAWAHELESVGTMHLLAACEEQGVGKLILRSHTLLYGPRPDNPLYLTENHPLRGSSRCSFVADKIDAERQVARFAARCSSVVTVLRMAPIVGVSSDNMVTDLLRQPVVPKVWGHDPLIQLVHELDVVAAFRLALEEDHPGTFNIVAPGVLPWSSLVRLAGGIDVAAPYRLARAMLGACHTAHVARPSPALLDYLRHTCVASGDLAWQQMGYRASYSTLESLRAWSKGGGGAWGGAQGGRPWRAAPGGGA
jgi:UDP-glucose 4-epimerase